MVDVKPRTVVHDPLSVDGLAALATHTPAFLFPKIYRGPARCSMQALSEWQLSIDSRHSDSAALAWAMPTVDGPEASCELECWYACSFVEHVRLEGGASTAAGSVEQGCVFLFRLIGLGNGLLLDRRHDSIISCDGRTDG